MEHPSPQSGFRQSASSHLLHLVERLESIERRVATLANECEPAYGVHAEAKGTLRTPDEHRAAIEQLMDLTELHIDRLQRHIGLGEHAT